MDQTMLNRHDNKRETPLVSEARGDRLSSCGVAFSIVLPAYNEAQRLPLYFESIRPYCDGRFSADYEVIVADDGSSDKTGDAVAAWSAEWPQLRYLRLPEHRGKGAAVRAGMLAARGRLLLFADADGATPIEEADRLRAAILEGADLAAGSRLLPGDDVCRNRDWLRGLLGRAFAATARMLLRLPVRDTQCGFKMFRHEAGKSLFGGLREEGYLFDLELLMLAERQGYRVAEVPVNWSEKPHGRFHWLPEAGRIAAGLIRLQGRRCRLAAHGKNMR